MKQQLTLYSKQNCHLCEVAKEELEKVKKQIGCSYEEIDIYENDELLELYGLMIPVVQYNGEIIQYGQITHHAITSFLNNGT
ncbi:glutaredoxin family protein [Bacillus sp. AGMB 02131]|uniref:Glutaredoxin family protein n=1 Tax=Peribacillus faecalis TaxID=2772559 RepID=A0A927HB25_9BACI|nr:glutaredoxin family protein [Peribacillus faecalis]MBD3108549.1 glutaredoxin family protein [Peribacillus faecalis]